MCPLPTAGDVHVNQPLTNISIAYTQDLKDFIAGQVFPVVPVQKQGDRYYTFDRSYWTRAEAKIRGLSEESAGAGFAVDSTPTYYCNVIALHKDIDDQVRANSDSMIAMDSTATKFVTEQMLLKREIDFMTNYFTTGVWTGSTTGTDVTPSTLWDASGCTPFLDIKKQIKSVKKKGKKPNILVLGEDVETALTDCADILDRIKYTQRGQITNELLASLLGLDKVLTAGAVKNTAMEGQTASYDFIASPKDALLLYANPQPSLMTPSAGYCFSWVGYLGAGPEGQRIKRFRMEHLASDRVEGEIAFDNKVVAADLGCYFSAAVG